MKNKKNNSLINSTITLLHSFKFVLFFSILTLITSCKKERITIGITELSTPTTAGIHDIVFLSPEIGYAAGGQRWSHGEFLETTDGGTTWTTDTITDKDLNGLSFSGNTAHLVGFQSEYQTQDLGGTSNWQHHPVDNPEELHRVQFYNDNLGIAVGGGSFHTGVIVRWENSTGGIDTIVSEVDHELRDVYFIDENNVIIVGYGIVMKSKDSGKTWVTNEIEGDFFYGIHFPTPQVGYIAGFSGTILKTTDGGENWSKLRNSNRLFVGKQAMRDVYFSSADVGYIVGEGGLFWKTEDGGDRWKIVEMPEVDLNAVFVYQGVGYVAGQGGHIYKFME